MRAANTHRNGPAANRGIALIVGLVILAVLSLIGVAAFSITTQEERMAGNSRDRMRAFEAAEAALRACENAAANGSTGVGMYQAPTSSATASTIETQGASEAFWKDSTKVLQLLDGNGKPFNGNAVAPSCAAEQFTLPNSYWVLGTPFNSTNSVNVAHVIAHGYGLNQNTVVRLESYYSM